MALKVMRGGSIIAAGLLETKQDDICMPSRAASGGGDQQERSVVNKSPMVLRS